MEVTTLLDCGPGSLRECIKNANEVPIQNSEIIDNVRLPNPFVYINFTVAGTITLKSSLPPIRRQYIGIVGNSTITVDCNSFCGFSVYGQGCEIKNLAIINSDKYAVGLFSDFNYISLLRIGIDYNDCIKPNEFGIVMINSNNNIIGNNNDRNQSYYSNIISGNKQDGIVMLNSKLNKIQNNIIGLDATGTIKVPNKYNGINIINSSDNIIGGDIFVDSNGTINNPTGNKGQEPGVFVRPLLGNLISGNKESGVKVVKSNNIFIKGNFIGTDLSGKLSLGNFDGVLIECSEYVYVEGCKIFNDPFVYYNVISGNKNAGIRVNNSKLTTIQGNFVGISSNNDAAVPNKNGVVIEGNSYIITAGGRIPLGNVIAGNKEYGFILADKSSYFTSFNTFCGLSAFGPVIPNGKSGFLFKDCTNNHDIRTNVISGNNGNGIEMIDDANHISIVYNIIGLDTRGNFAFPNSENGILIKDNVNNISIIDDNVPSIIPRNCISSNLKTGIVLEGNSNNITITGTLVGLDISATEPMFNGENAIYIGKNSYNNTIGSLTGRNYITSQIKPAIEADGNWNVISENSINTNVLLLPVSLSVPFTNKGCNNEFYANDVNQF